MNKLLIASLSVFLFISCNEDDSPDLPPSADTGTVNLNFEFKVGDETLDLGESTHVIAGEDTIVINQFKFILSNLSFTNPDGGKWHDEDGYYLVKASEGSSGFKLQIEDVPASDYTGMEFYIGMDSAMNFKPEDFPILFQQEGMYWDWNTGYKFLLLEGGYFSTSLGTPNNRLPFIAHVGDMINLKVPQFDFSENINVNAGSEIDVNFSIDLGKIYSDPNRLSLSEVNNRNIMGGPLAAQLSENYGEGMILLME